MGVTLEQIVIIAGGLMTIISLAKLVVEPFNRAMKQNQTAMKSLEKSIDSLSFDLKDSQRDRENIHKVLDRHEMRIGKAEDAIIVNNERIATLSERGK
ncbi:hypothetical protein [Globicatella sp. PHS-GS-PNBC-21-1553]|uniref:hypothetical protein n=1 Tax=Globicatella sp. PHS-GS-PNBC-21-1553 TaxID=2885764 RepID=UPI00298F16D7|nr:hypothetical protein [Globicatella sp. PHS-GS-PNBC-21-1553]WPC08020.1 hypothetical protein LB888_08170 [Globicatella sp. PHS-GS-PNBC-21-1553]